MIPVTQQVMRQTKARIFKNDPHAPNKLVSLFETATQIIRKEKSAKPTEFGRLVKIPESENQIITHHEVCDGRPADSSLLLTEIHRSSPATVRTCSSLDRCRRGLQLDQRSKKRPTKMGVKRLAIPHPSTKSTEWRALQKKRWFRQAQAWRTGSEGRISVVKRRHGLNRCGYRGDAGMKRWVGLGVIADNLINLGKILALRATK